MPLTKIKNVLQEELENLKSEERAKGKELIVVDAKKPDATRGARFLLKGYGNKEFIRMNSNSYLGMQFNEEVIKAEEEAAKKFGVGPGAVRFISGTYEPHRNLEKKLANFHNREDAMIFSSAYMTVVGIISSLTTPETAIISDELNHNCIINAIRLSKPKERYVYKHLDYEDLENSIKSFINKTKRIIIVTDGVFSMRGDYADLNKIQQIAQKFDEHFEENIITIVDDSHGVGAYGPTGRGTEEVTNGKADLLIGTMGKAYGVNGGYVVSNEVITTYLREKTITYIYSNPITSSEAASVLKVLEILDSNNGIRIIEHLEKIAKKFRDGIVKLGYETVESRHPIVPLLVKDASKTKELVNHLLNNGILATGINYPVVPKGSESIRFQINADHTSFDIDYVLNVLEKYKKEKWDS